MALQDELEVARSEIKTDAYQMSIGELMNLYSNGELEIHPEFQRVYRWRATQKSRLIESILLGIPLPDVFVAAREDGVWDVVDGLQRLSTIFEFAGMLKDDEGNAVPPLVLENTKYLPSLSGVRWETKEGPSLTQEQRLSVKRTRLGVKIILKESSENAKYELFQRLNTGGSKLTEQEVRNCLLIMLNKDVYQWLQRLSEDTNFLAACAFTERSMDEAYHMELALRFIVFRKAETGSLRGIRDLGVYLTDEITELVVPGRINLDEEERAFKKTFEIINEATGGNAFRRMDPKSKRFMGAFTTSAYEAIAIGLGNYYDGEMPARITIDIVNKAIINFWKGVPKAVGALSGQTASQRIPKTISFGRSLFSNEGTVRK